MYLFVNDYTIQGYNGEILKRYLGNKLVRTISNPTEKHLREFGYKPLDDTAEPPEYDKSAQYLIEKYTEETDKIVKGYEIKNIEIPENIAPSVTAENTIIVNENDPIDNAEEINLGEAEA